MGKNTERTNAHQDVIAETLTTRPKKVIVSTLLQKWYLIISKLWNRAWPPPDWGGLSL